MKFLLTFACAFSLLGQPHLTHLATTDDGSTLYFASTLRFPGAGQSLASKLFKFDSSGVHLIDDQGFGPTQVTYFDFLSPSVSGDGSRLVYAARQYCGYSNPCFEDDWSVPKTPPGAPRLFLPSDVGAAAISRKGRYGIGYGAGILDTELTSTVVLIDFLTGTRTKLSACPPAQVTSTGVVLAVMGGCEQALEIFTPDGTITKVAGASLAAISDDGSTLAYTDSKTGQLFAKKGIGSPAPIGIAGQTNTQESLTNDGTAAIFLSSANAPAVAQLYYTRTDGSGLLPLTNVAEGVSEAIISGDGRVVYAITNAGALLRIDTATASATQMVAPYPMGVKFQGAGSPGSIVVANNFNAPLPSAVGTPPYSAPLAGLTVTVEDLPAPLLLVSPTQIQFQIPWEAPALLDPFPDMPGQFPTLTGVVLPGGGPLFEAAFPLKYYFFYPQILSVGPPEVVTFPGSSPFTYAPIATRLDGTPVTFEHPAKSGDTLVLYGTGFGGVTSRPANGLPSPLSPLAVVTPPLQLSLGRGGPSVTAPFLGLAPGLVGLYQLNLNIPKSFVLPAGNFIGVAIPQYDLGIVPFANSAN